MPPCELNASSLAKPGTHSQPRALGTFGSHWGRPTVAGSTMTLLQWPERSVPASTMAGHSVLASRASSLRHGRHALLTGGVLAGLLGVFGEFVKAEPPRPTDPPASPAITPAESIDRVPDGWKESVLLRNIRQVTFAGQRAEGGSFSPEGARLIFQSERTADNPFFQIYVTDLRTGETERVSSGDGKATDAWFHPRQDKVLFASTHADPHAADKQRAAVEAHGSGRARRHAWDFDDHYDIYETALDALPDRRRFHNLTKAHGYDAEGSWSPDGAFIAFASNRHAYTDELSEEDLTRFRADPSSQVDIYLMRADGSGVQRLTSTAGYDGGPFFSPNGEQIVWRRFSPDGSRAEVWTMRTDGTQQRRLTELGGTSWAPVFHPSGEYVVFTTNLHGFGNFELYVVDSLGRSEPVRVTYTEGFDGLPAFSPDGSRLAWTSTRTGNEKAQLFFADWNDDEARCELGLDMRTAYVAAVRSCELRRDVVELASERMDGRLTGSDGERRATAYAAAQFEQAGLLPAGDTATFFQSFSFTSGVSLGPGNVLQRHADADSTVTYTVQQDWRPLTFSKTGSFPASDVVFGGYGIVAPAFGDKPAYDSYAELDMTDCWVVVFRYLPEDIDAAYRQHLNRYAGLRYKAMVARDRGARGLVVVSGPNSAVREELVPLSSDASLGITSVGLVSVTDTVAEAWLAPAGQSLRALQDSLDSGQPVPGFRLDGIVLDATIDVRQEKRTGRNVLARLPANAPPADDVLVVGAHIDHLGRGKAGGWRSGSLARADESGHVHYGADDNASGVAAVLAIAKSLAAQRAAGTLTIVRDVLFGLWSGEEVGLLGSSHFTKTFGRAPPAEPGTRSPAIAAYLNLDMVGRLDSRMVLQGVGSSPAWPAEIESQNVAIGLPLILQPDSYLPTDATPFYLKGVPVLNAFTGAHEDYHSPRDTPDKLNYAGLTKITRLMAGLTRSLATNRIAPDYVAPEKPTRPTRRAHLRAYLGTIPDYAQTESIGVRLTGVARGGPADLAGVRDGDVIVKLAGRAVENIYDYTYVVESLKVGRPVVMGIERGGVPLELTIRPTSRE